MSEFPISSDYFVGGQRLTPIDSSEGGAPLSELLNSVGVSAESQTVVGSAVDLSAATAAVVKAANRGLSTNAGAARAYTLPDFDSAPAGWEHTFLALTTHDFTITHAGTDTINGIAGDVVLGAAHVWCKIMKLSGATGWIGIGGTMITPA